MGTLAVVTGAGSPSGIGFAIAHALGAAGHGLLIASTTDRIHERAAELRAAGFDARGVGLPGHFVTRVSYAGRSVFVDPYHAGQVISEDDCRQLVSRTTGRPSLFRRSLLQGTDERSMLTRLLLNLKYIYVKSEDFPRALAAVERLLLIAPDDPTEIRDRGFLHAHLGSPGAAVSDLESYLALTPDARDAASVRGRVAWLRQRLSEYN